MLSYPVQRGFILILLVNWGCRCVARQERGTGACLARFSSCGPALQGADGRERHVFRAGGPRCADRRAAFSQVLLRQPVKRRLGEDDDQTPTRALDRRQRCRGHLHASHSGNEVRAMSCFCRLPALSSPLASTAPLIVRSCPGSGRGGAPVTSKAMETRVWEQRDGAWKNVHFHRSP